jgi:hypothetical protein
MEDYQQRHLDGEAYGIEGSLPAFPDWSSSTISYEKLKKVLSNTAISVDPRVGAGDWVTKADGTMIENILGKQDIYNVAEALAKLRAIPSDQKTSEQRLLQRALSIISYDGLNPVSLSKVNPLTIYDDLGLTDKAIQPYLSPISMVSERASKLRTDANGTITSEAIDPNQKPDFFVFNLYKDDTRRIRFHVYHPFAKPGDELHHDDRPHEHDGKSASLVLNGCLINQHMKTEKTDKEHADFGVYKLRRLTPNEDRRFDKRGERQFYAKFHMQTSHGYKPGEQYFLPASPRQEKLNEADLSEHEKLSIHRVAAMPQTVTLFTQQYAPDRALLTTFPKDFPDKVQQSRVPDDESIHYPIDQAHELLLQMDKNVRTSLAAVRKPSTIIDRAEQNHDQEMSELIARRLAHPLTPSLTGGA